MSRFSHLYNYWNKPRQIAQRLSEQEVSQDVQDTDIAAVEADIAEIAPLGPAGVGSDKRFNDYLFTGVCVPFKSAETKPEGWFKADGTNGTENFTITLPTGWEWIQQVGPYPS